MRAIRHIFCITLLASFTICAAFSQGTVSLTGTVTDTTAAVIPGVDVGLTNQATSAVRTTTTNESGAYSFPQLPPGTYRVEFKLAGFRTAIRDNVVLPIGTTQVLSISLEVGTLSQDVVVEGGAVPVNTIDASEGNPFSELQVKQLPLEARNPSQLLSLQAGVVWAGEALNDQRQGSVFGSRANQGNITLDGADVNDQVNQTTMQSVLPIPLDSVQEFRVTTTGGGAQYGRSSGAQIELVTKSGSNDWHGSAYEFNRNEALASNGFFENRLGIPRAPLKRNIFGASAGGPIKKQRAFFFVNWESRRDSTATPQTRVVPTDSLRDGVLLYQCATPSACPAGTVTGLSSSHPVPAGWYGLTPTQIAQVIDPCGSAPCVDILGKTITPGVNPSVIALWKGYPFGNDPSLGATGIDAGFNTSGLRFAAPITVNNNDFVARLDFNLDRDGKHTLYWRGSLAGDRQVNQPQQFPIDPLTAQPGAPVSSLLNNSKGMAISYTALLRPNLINTFRYGFTRQGLDTGGTQGPSYSMRGIDSFRSFTRALVRTVPTHSFVDDMTWTKGKHSIQFGFTTRYITNNRASMSKSFESYSISNNNQNGLGKNCVLPGSSADTCPNGAKINALPRITGSFNPYLRAVIDILGVISSGSATYQFDLNGNVIPFGTPQLRQYVNSEYESYVQDAFRITSNLTITAGIRYSYATVPYESHGLQVIPSVELGKWFADRIVNMQNGVPSHASPLISFIPGGKVNHAPGWFSSDTGNFAPRASFAYSPSFDSGPGHVIFGGPGKTSVRGGFSMFYDRLSGGLMGLLANQGETGLASATSTPFTLLDTAGNSSLGTKTAPRFAGYDNLPPISAFLTVPKGGFPATAPSDDNNTQAGMVGNLHTPYALQYSLSVQREIGNGTVLDVGYVGRFGRKLLIQADFSQWLNLKDTKSGMTYWEAFNQLEQGMHTLTTSYDGVCIKTPASCPVIPYFENVFPGMAAYWGKATGKTFNSNTAAMADFAVNQNAPDFGGVTQNIDINIPHNSGISVYNSQLDPQGVGAVLMPPQYHELSVYTNNAQSFYNGLLISVRRHKGGVQLDANYVLSKSIDDGSGLESESSLYNGVLPDSFTPRAERGLSDFDLRHNFNANVVYELPVGRGKAFASNLPNWADEIVGGWEITDVTRWRSGFPLGVVNGSWFPTVWNIHAKATKVAPIQSEVQKNAPGGPNMFSNPVSTQSGNPFNAAGTAYAAYIHTPMGGSGTRNDLRGSRFFTIDTGLGKSFRLANEKQRLQFRWEIFNLLNTVNFAGGGGTLTGSDTIYSDVILNLDSPGSFGRFVNASSSASQSYPLVPHNRVMQLGLRFEF